MYSHEIQKLLEMRNYLIDNKEYLDICDTSPQINHIKYEPYEDNFHMWTKDNYEFKFKVYKKEAKKC